MSRVDRFIYDRTEDVCRWVENIIGTKFYGYLAVGMERNGELIAGIVCDRFSPQECSMHIASKPGVMWATKEACRRAFEFPFVRCGVNRITVETPVHNARALAFNDHIGFVREGIKRGAGDDGCDMVLFGMLRSECRWLD